MYQLMIPEKYIEKIFKIMEESGQRIAQQTKMGIEQYLFKYTASESHLKKRLGQYKLPQIGELLFLNEGRAKVISISESLDRPLISSDFGFQEL